MLPKLPQGVLKSVVAGPGVHKVYTTHLFDVTQTLELRSVNDLHQQGVEFYVSVYRVIEYLYAK